MHAGNGNFIQKTDEIINKLKEANDWIQTVMAVAQQKEQKYADKFKAQTPISKIKNKIWLTLKNIATAIENKKLDAKQAKYTIFEDMGSHNCKLNTPPNIRNVFHVDRLRAVSIDLFFPKIFDDNHPGLFIVNEKPPDMTLSASWKKKTGPRLPIFGQIGKLCSFKSRKDIKYPIP